MCLHFLVVGFLGGPTKLLMNLNDGLFVIEYLDFFFGSISSSFLVVNVLLGDALFCILVC